MTMPRALVEKLGPFDERFGSGSVMGSGGDTDYLLRAYVWRLCWMPITSSPRIAILRWTLQRNRLIGA